MEDSAKQDKKGNIVIGIGVLEQQITEVECAIDKLGSKIGNILIDNISTPSDEKELKEEKIQCALARDINNLTTRVIIIRRSLTDLIERVDI